jgi:hypothetical protein
MGRTMKKFFIIFLVFTIIARAQYRDELNRSVDVKSGILNNSSSGSLLSFINPDNFSMNHSFEMSYSAFGGGGMALGVYTNSMSFKFNDQLKLETDLSLVNSPYNSFGKDFSKNINGVYLSRVQLTYKPFDNMSVIVQYRQLPGGYYSPFGYTGYSSFFRDNFFGF